MPIHTTSSTDGTNEILLRLEYVCTPAEKAEAQSLSLRQQIGGGSKTLTMTILLVVAVVLIWCLWEMMAKSITAGEQPYVIAGLIAVFLFVFIRNHFAKRDTTELPTVVELSQNGIHLAGNQAQATLSWGMFSGVLESKSLFVLRDRTKSTLYIIPKRVLPTKEWIDWLREATSRICHDLSIEAQGGTDLVPPTSIDTQNPPDVIVQFRLGFWNCVDLMAASWFGRFCFLGWNGMIVGIWGYSFFDPHPHAKFNELEMLCYFVVPMALVGGVFVLMVVSVHKWFGYRIYLRRKTVSLGDTGLSESSVDGTFNLPWTTYTRYKETPWCLLLWDISSGRWQMIPKSAFDSAASLNRARELLERHLKRSTWFFGG
ncbi:MAG: YcxB family protein [Phycisphaerae bacterium]